VVDKERLKYYDYLQRLMGYCVTGETLLKMFMIWLGLGANGKSLLADWSARAFGEYYAVGSQHLMAASKYGSQAGAATPHVMVLENDRMVTVEEMPAVIDGCIWCFMQKCI
jgi:phage/plasmid-associated DNA primase